jgi:phage shock protein C
MTAKTNKQLKRGSDVKLLGVCSGFADYFGIDVTLVRLGYILLTAFTGFFPGVIAYFIIYLVMPEK